MSSKPALSPETLRSQEAAFIEHYGWLIRWALQLTNHDRAHAEDLVQEVFAQLVFRNTDLSEVQNIRGYLYTSLRNIHVSETRIAGRSHIQLPSVIEYNLAATALSASNPHDLYQTQDQLRRICHYACVRKQSSRAGSVIILRFFFGYHLSEIAQVLGGTCQAVRQCLRFARNEAQAFLEDPGALSFIDRAQTLKSISPTPARGAEELLSELRLAIFRSRQGECLDSGLLNAFYQKGLILTASNSTLAHIVSCQCCLDTANRALNLPLLRERHPADALGPDNSSNGGPRASGSSGGTKHNLRVRARNQDREEDISSSFLLRCRRRARELFEHHPRELCISVNGYVLGSQWVNSEISRLRLDITIPEPLRFIEVMSEENARLLIMTIAPPPSGEPTQTRYVVLSEGRHIEATLRYGHPWPMLEVVYRDLNFTAESVVSGSEADGECGLTPTKDSAPMASWVKPASVDQPMGQAGMSSLTPMSPQPSLLKRFTQAGRTLSGVIRGLGHHFARWPLIISRLNGKHPGSAAAGLSTKRSEADALFNFSRSINLIRRPVWSRPSVITAIFSMFLIAALLFLRLNITAAVSAANLIERATTAERALNRATDRAVHRVINLEERAHAGGALISRSRIEIWRDPRRNLHVRRVYDEKGRLILGEWMTNDAQTQEIVSGTIYHRDETSRIEPSARSPQAAIRNAEFWQLELSAKEYAEMIGGAEAARVREDSLVYVVTYTGGQPAAVGTPWQATLTLRKSDLHPIEQMLIVERGGEQREYRFVEASFERPPVGALTPEIFGIDPELFSETVNRESGTVKRENDSRPPSSLNPASPIVATTQLEVEVAYLLDPFRTKFGDQINLTRTPEGLLRVDGVVDTEQSREEILQALSAISHNSAVTVQISTVTEALKRQQHPTKGVIVHEFSASENRMPAYAELHRYFSQRRDARAQAVGASAKDDHVDPAVRSFAANVVGRSRRVLSHAIELRQLRERFSAPQLNVLTPSSRAKWFGMIRAHAETLGREASLLDQELGPIFYSDTRGPEIGRIEILIDADLARAIEQLYKLVLANDEIIRSAFTAGSEPSAATLLKGRRFYVSLATVEKLAQQIRQGATAMGKRD